MDSAPAVAVFGLGYVGLATAVGMALRGCRVRALDLDQELLERLRRGECHLSDQDLAQGLRDALQQGSLDFTAEAPQALDGAEFAFVCVGTPARDDGAADLGAVEAVLGSLAEHAPADCLAVIKSTVPPGTADKLRCGLRGRGLASSPEFLREGSALRDVLQPDRIVLGTAGEGDRARLEALYRKVNPSCLQIHCSCASAELVKYGSNVFLAAKIAFVGELARLAERLPGADINAVARGMGRDPRIAEGHLVPRTGFGGPCFPKDVAALASLMGEFGSFPLTGALAASNERHRDGLVESLQSRLRELGRELSGATVAVWGLTFKPGVKDLRDSGSLHMIQRLLDAGARVQAWDPAVPGSECPPQLRGLGAEGGRLSLAANAVEACAGADALMILTEDPAFAGVSAQAVAAQLRTGLVYDCCRGTDARGWLEAGLSYGALGQGEQEQEGA